MRELWLDGVVSRESCMFAGKREVKLLFPAQEIIKVEEYCSGRVFQPGMDYLHTPGSDRIELAEKSGIPFIEKERMRPEKDVRLRPAEDCNAIEGAVDGGYLIFGESGFFAENQIAVTYRAETAEFDGMIDPQRDRLPRFRKKLSAGDPLQITLIGDSISVGANASKFMNKPPYEPFYLERTVEKLSEKYGSRITLTNRAVGGAGIRNAAGLRDDYLGDQADLLVIAYGMNDYFRTPADEFMATLDLIINESRKVNRHTEYLVVSGMSGNPLWKYTAPGNDLIFAEKLREFAGFAPSDTALADVNKVWQEIAARKGFYDLTGNGVNHPNDFGHRIYASVLLEILTG